MEIDSHSDSFFTNLYKTSCSLQNLVQVIPDLRANDAFTLNWTLQWSDFAVIKHTDILWKKSVEILKGAVSDKQIHSDNIKRKFGGILLKL